MTQISLDYEWEGWIAPFSAPAPLQKQIANQETIILEIEAEVSTYIGIAYPSLDHPGEDASSLEIESLHITSDDGTIWPENHPTYGTRYCMQQKKILYGVAIPLIKAIEGEIYDQAEEEDRYLRHSLRRRGGGEI